MATFMCKSCSWALMKKYNLIQNARLPAGECTVRFLSNNRRRKRNWLKSKKTARRYDPKDITDPSQFPIFVIKGRDPWYENQFKRRERKINRFNDLNESTPRFRKMKDTDDWKAIWPTAATFKMYAVPLPLRQGVVQNASENEGIIPDKFANLELMKVPNFLHLTPQHVKAHCEALKDVCTKWPVNVTIKKAKDYLPLEIISRDYCFAGSSIRDERARTVTLKVSVDRLHFAVKGAKHKFLDLVGDKYDEKTRVLTLTADRCPTKKQNEEFLMYMLTAIYQESHIFHPWETSTKTFEDHRKFVWEDSKSAESVKSFMQKALESVEDASNMNKDNIMKSPAVKKYGRIVKKMERDGESSDTLTAYKESVLKLLNITLTDNEDSVDKDVHEQNTGDINLTQT